MLIRRSEVWTRQPQYPVSVKRSLRPAAAAIHTTILARDLVSGRASYLYGGAAQPSLVIGPAGKGVVNTTTTGYASMPAFPVPEMGGCYTVICLASVPSIGNTYALVDTDDYPDTRHFQFRVESDGRIGHIPFNTGGNPCFSYSGSSVTAGVPFVSACRVSSPDSGAASTTWLNGLAGTSVTIGGTPQSAHCDVSIGGGRSGYTDDLTACGATIYAWIIFPYAVDDTSLSLWTRNPAEFWKLFEDDRRTLFVPSGAGGTTSVTSDSAASYLIRNAISQDLASAFGIRGAVQADSAASYAVRGAAQSNLSGAYSLRGSAFKDATAAYSIRGMVQSDEVASYNLRGSVQSSESASYAVRGAVSSDRSATYDILSASAVSSSLDASFAVRGAVPSDQAASFVVRGAAQSNQVVSYSIRGLVQSSLSAGYSIDAGVSAVSSDLLVSYFVDGAAAQWPTAEQNAAAVIAALNATTIPVNIKQVNSTPIKGSGVVGDTWGPV